MQDIARSTPRLGTRSTTRPASQRWPFLFPTILRLTETIPLPKVEWEEEADTWRLIRRIDDRRRDIDRSRVAIGPIRTPAALALPLTLLPAMLLPAALLVPLTLLPVALLVPLAPIVLLAERRHQGYRADHRGEGECHDDRADCRAYMLESRVRGVHSDLPFLERCPPR